MDGATQERIRGELSKILPRVQVSFDDALDAAGQSRVQLTPDGVMAFIDLNTAAPFSTAYHEAMHSVVGFLLNSPGSSDIRRVLTDMANDQRVTAQLKKLLANEPAALAQLSDPEERTAYAFEFWQLGQLELVPKASGMVGKVLEWMRSKLGVWTNNERAQNLFSYIRDGRFAEDYGDPGAVQRAVMEPGRNKWLDAATDALKPVRQVADSVFVSSLARLHDSGVPALQGLAAKLHTDPEVGEVDPVSGRSRRVGYVQAVYRTASQWMNRHMRAVEGANDADLQAALQILQGGKPDVNSAKVSQIVTSTRSLLREVFDKSKAAGVNLNDLGPEYFPRMWDSAKIMEDAVGFKRMLQRYDVSAQDADNIVSRLVREPTSTDHDVPLWANQNRRELPNFQYEDMAPYLQNNLTGIMAGYLRQAAKRSEFVSRFGEQGEKIDSALKLAEEQGATPAELSSAKDAVDNILGTKDFDASPIWDKISAWGMTAANIAFLPLAIFNSAHDPLALAIRDGDTKKAWSAYKKAVLDVPKWLKDSPDYDSADQLGLSFGTIAHHGLHNAIAAASEASHLVGNPKRINDAFFKWNLMEGWTTSLRSMATVQALDFIEQHIQQPSENSARWLAELGLDKKNQKLLKFADGKLVRDPDNAALSSAVHRYVDSVVLRPNSAERPGWSNDPRFKLLWHLKSYAYTFQRAMLNRATEEAFTHKNYAPMGVLAAFIPVIAGSMLVKALLTHGGSLPTQMANWGALDWAMAAAQKAGLGGTSSMWAPGLSDPVSVAGPAVSAVADSLGHQYTPGSALGSAVAAAASSGDLAKGVVRRAAV